jgi:cell division protein FtsZ
MSAKAYKRSLQFAFIGSGEGGGRMAATFGRMGYPAAAINTTGADLARLRLPGSQKLVLPIAAGGAGQEPELGRQAVLVHQDRVQTFLRAMTLEADHVILCIGGGGGTGTGSLPELVHLLQELKRPVGVIYTLPRDVECTAVKVNALRALSGIYQMAQAGEISPLMLVDNNRIGELFPEVSLARFWPKGNQFLADLWDAFNRLSVRESEFYSALDGTDYLRLLSAGKCAALGYAEVTDLKSAVGLARAMSEAVHRGLLAGGFDLSTASAVGTIIVGSANTLRHLPAAYLDNGLRVIREIMKGGYAFSGVYADSGVYARLKLYVLFGGLDLPLERVEELARETQGEYEVLQEKLQVSNPKSQVPNFSFMEGGLRLERGGSTLRQSSGQAGLTTGGGDDEDNVFARMARKRR